MVEAKWKCWVFAGRKTVNNLQAEHPLFIHTSGKFLDDDRKCHAYSLLFIGNSSNSRTNSVMQTSVISRCHMKAVSRRTPVLSNQVCKSQIVESVSMPGQKSGSRSEESRQCVTNIASDYYGGGGSSSSSS